MSNHPTTQRRQPSALACAAILLLLILLGSHPLRAADGPSPAELRLRENMRKTLLQLRTVQNDNAILQSAKTELEQKTKDLEDKNKQLTQNLVDDKNTADKTIASLNTKLTASTEENTSLKTELQKTRADLAAATTLAQTKETERTKLAADNILLTRTIADQKTKNTELYNLAREILLRYEKFSLGEALGAKEPFIGTKRVKLETYIQDTQDKLTDQKIKPGTTPAAKTP